MEPNGVAPSITRFQYLLNGRRVRVKDLIDAELLEPGTELHYTRLGQTHVATVTAAGELQLDNGRLFRTPSAAGDAVSGISTPGWNVWVVAESGQSLDSLRQRLLAEAAEQSITQPAPPRPEALSSEQADEDDDESAATSSPQNRYEYLRAAREQADQGTPVALTVRELLGWWGAGRRGSLICQRIDADLANHGLTTTPDYRAIGMDSRLELQAVRFHGLESSPGEDEENGFIELRRTVGTVPSASEGIVSVPPTATIEEALTVMLLGDYSQLPVMSGKQSVEGAVTWKSIANARNADSTATLKDAFVRVEPVAYHRDLREVLPQIQQVGFVLVRGASGTVDGIVTASDVAGLFGDFEEPFLLIGELDLALRAVFASEFELDDVNALCRPGRRGFAGFDDMSYGDYQRVLEEPDMWAKLGWPLNRAIFVKRLDEIRRFRNDFMHYTPDPNRAALPKIREMINVVRKYGGV